MTEKKPTEPELIEDKDLEDASGGLPAVQKVRDAASRIQVTPTITPTAYKIEVDGVKAGDGSV